MNYRMVAAALPPKADRGRPLTAPRLMLNAVFWVLRSGAPWRDLPERFGPWQTVYHHFNSWRRHGVYERSLKTLQVRLDAEGQIDWGLWFVDGTIVRASRSADGAGKKGLRRAHRPRAGSLARRIREQAPPGR